MSLDSNKILARAWFEEVMNARDLDAIDRAYAADYAYRGPGGEPVRGREGARRVAAALHEAMPDRVSTVVMQVAEGDLVVTRWVSHGTQTGPLMGRPPTNQPVEVHGITISRIEDGLIAEDWEIIKIL
ncbi:MAG: ester cyclase [Acidimicrobiia bacterium]|nr:MAG: ester cyclase [Acidimicrobiia bacterium]